MSAKAAYVVACPSLLAALPEGAVCVGPSGISSAGAGYHLLAADVRSLDALGAALHRAGWEAAEPTLVLAECVLVYLPAVDSAALLAWFGARCAHVAIAAYEQVS